MTLTPEEQAAAAARAAQDPGAVPAPSAAQPAPAAEPVAPAPTSTAPATPAPAKTPWDTDLAERFPDEATRNAVSAYLGEKVQPYVTQLEQSSADARELLDDFRSAPKDTFLEIAAELIEAEALSPEDLKAYIETLPPAEQAEVATAAAAQQPPGQEQPQRDPEIQAIIDERQDARDKEAFDAEVERIKAAHPDLIYDESLFIPEVARLGDFNKAVTAYQEKYGDYLTWRASQTPAEEATTPTAPATVGVGEAAGGSEQPTEKKYETLDDAVDDYFAERRAAGKPIAPPVPTG